MRAMGPPGPHRNRAWIGAVLLVCLGAGALAGKSKPLTGAFIRPFPIGVEDGIFPTTLNAFKAYLRAERQGGQEGSNPQDTTGGQSTTTDQSKRLLTKDELTASRHGVARDDIQVHSENNEVIPAIDGEIFMKMLYIDLENTGPGDYIHGTFFDETGNVILDPHPDPTDRQNVDTTLQNTLLRAIDRGVQVRLMANLVSYLPLNAVSFCKPFNQRCGNHNCCVPDRRHNSLNGSMHAKLWVIQAKGDTSAYIGGIDVAAGRYDTSAHNQAKKVVIQPPLVGQTYHGWHDNMFRVRGPAVADFARHFWQRWNDPASPAPKYTPEPFEWSEPLRAENTGALTVQFLRTLSCKGGASYGFHWSYAPFGERSFDAAFKKMISSAREYIYLEDQFMFYPEIMAYVRESLRNVKKIILVTNSYATWDNPVLSALRVNVLANTRRYYQRLALEELAKPDSEGISHRDKIHVYELLKPNGRDLTPSDLVYVHSKNYLVDDAFCIVGSAGIERAGFTNDEDVAMGIYDQGRAGSDSFVGLLRRVTWAEHLGVEYTDKRLSDPVSALALFEEAADTKGARVKRYWPEPIEHAAYMDTIYGVFESNGDCSETELAAAQSRRLADDESPFSRSDSSDSLNSADSLDSADSFGDASVDEKDQSDLQSVFDEYSDSESDDLSDDMSGIFF